MRARIVSVGERMPVWVAEGFAEYRKRLVRDLPLELVEIRLGERGKGRDIARALQEEGAAMLMAIPREAHVIALDSRGKPWSSEDLAREFARWRMDGRDLVFLVGGPDGLAPMALERSMQRWSLGPLTLPHMLVRVLLVEQLYRAVSMLGNHPYHRA